MIRECLRASDSSAYCPSYICYPLPGSRDYRLGHCRNCKSHRAPNTTSEQITPQHPHMARYLYNLLNLRHALLVLKVDTSRSLPPRCGKPSRSRFVQLSCRRWLLATQCCHQWCNIFRLHGQDFIFRPDCACHVRTGRGRHGVDKDIVFSAFASDSFGEADDATFLFTD